MRHVEVPNIIHEARRSTRPGVIFHAVGPLLYNRLLAPSTPAHIYKLSTTKGNHVRCFRAVRVRHVTTACADCFDQTCQGWQLRHLLDVQRPTCRGTRSPECPRRARRGCGALSFSLSLKNGMPAKLQPCGVQARSSCDHAADTKSCFFRVLPLLLAILSSTYTFSFSFFSFLFFFNGKGQLGASLRALSCSRTGRDPGQSLLLSCPEVP